MREVLEVSLGDIWGVYHMELRMKGGFYDRKQRCTTEERNDEKSGRRMKEEVVLALGQVVLGLRRVWEIRSTTN